MNQAVTINVARSNRVETMRDMGRWQQRLWLLLLIQVLLVVGVYAYQQNSRATPTAVPLLPVSTNVIDRIEIADATTSVHLNKQANRWQLTQSSLPVDNEKITALLEKLNGLRLTWPVANTASSHERFEVGEQKFQRKLRLYEGDKLQAEFYLGSSPGFKKVHLRRAGDNQVYSVALSTMDATTSGDDWLNKQLLTTTNPVNIKGRDYELQKQGENWQLVGETGVSLNTEKVTALVKALASLQVQSVVHDAPKGEPITLAVKSAEGNWQYDFIKTDAGHVVKRSDREQYFSLSQYEYERIAQVTRESLLAPATATQTSPTTSNSAATNPVEAVVQEATKGLLGN